MCILTSSALIITAVIVVTLSLVWIRVEECNFEDFDGAAVSVVSISTAESPSKGRIAYH